MTMPSGNEKVRDECAGKVLSALAHHGILLKQDKTMPSVVGIITGESLSTSWWSHPKSHLIFSVLSRLGDHPEVLFTKLLSRKDTLIHVSLWPALLAVACSREPWQLHGMSGAAVELLRRIDAGAGTVRAIGPVAKEIEVRVLAASREVHTESGRHEIRLETWQSWSARVGCEAQKSIGSAKQSLEQTAAKLGAPPGALPWCAATC